MSFCTDKSAAITGAGSGIGRALARQLHREGCRLYLSDVDSAGLEQTRASLAGAATVDTQRVDVADRDAINTWANAVNQREGRVNIVVNNAGVGLSDRVEEANYDDIQWLMGVNFWGVVHGTMAFLPLLQRAQQDGSGAHLVNVSSVFGMIGVPTQTAYNAAKFAVRGYTEALRMEVADSGMHVCCVHPGGIRTNIARSSRGGSHAMTPDERGASFEQFARTTPEQAAAKIVGAIEKRKKRLLIGTDAHYVALISRLFPVSYPKLMPGLGQLAQD